MKETTDLRGFFSDALREVSYSMQGVVRLVARHSKVTGFRESLDGTYTVFLNVPKGLHIYTRFVEEEISKRLKESIGYVVYFEFKEQEQDTGKYKHDPRLSPCPFCSDIAEFCGDSAGGYVKCENCGARTDKVVPTSHMSHWRTEAAALWNSRVPQD